MIKTSLLTVFLSACAAHGESYTLVISPAFTDEYAASITAAARDWERMVPATFDVKRDWCFSRERTTTCVFAEDNAYFAANAPKGAVGYTSCAGGVDDACFIRLDVEWPGDEEQLAGHELGHAMGLPHEGPGTSIETTGPVVMAPHMGDAAPRPTCLDAAAWYALRGWVVPYACGELPDSSSSFE